MYGEVYRVKASPGVLRTNHFQGVSRELLWGARARLRPCLHWQCGPPGARAPLAPHGVSHEHPPWPKHSETRVHAPAPMSAALIDGPGAAHSTAERAALRRLADPLAYQILPSRSVVGGGGGASSVGGDPRVPLAHRGPRPRPLARDAASLSREVLPDDTYAAALDSIVEARWFPDLPRLQQQLAWLTALDGGDPTSIALARAGIASSVRRAPGAVSATPLGAGAGGGGGGGASAAPPPAPAPAPDAPPRLSDFLSRFTSQASDDFAGNLAARLVNLRRRSWWLHAHVDGARWRAMLADGHAARAAPAPAALLADAANEEGVEVPRVALPGAELRGTVRTWRWRPRNALFFPPTLAAGNSACGVGAAKPDPDLPAHAALLPPLGGGGGGGARALALPALSQRYAGMDLVLPGGARVKPSGALRAPAEVRAWATRIGGRAGEALEAAARAAPPAPSEHYGLPPATGARSYGFLATPLLVPHGGGAGGGGALYPPHALPVTPIVTWGQVAATPLMLDAPAPPRAHPATAAALAAALGLAPATAGEGAYALPPPSAREGVRDGLLARASARRRAAGAPAPASASLLAAAAAAAAAGVLGSAARSVAAGGWGTPVYAAAGTPSTLRGAPAPAASGSRAGGSGSSVAPSAAGGGMSGGGLRHARASAEAALQRLPPAARALVEQAAAGEGAGRRRAAAGEWEGALVGKRARS
jgi:protein DGCR14